MDYIKALWGKNEKAIIDGLLEIGRLILLAIIPLLIGRVTDGAFNPELQVGLLVALRFIDKYLHTMGKETNNDLLVTGLTRF